MEWRKVGFLFSSWDQTRIFISAGFRGAAKEDPGKLWIDDLKLEEAGPDVAVARR